MITVNPGQGQLVQAAQFRMRRAPAQEAMVNTAKAVTGVVVDASCVLVKAGANIGAAGLEVCVAIPQPVRDIAIDGCANAAKETVKKIANTAIDSDFCYGSEDSCVSKTTTWIKDQF